VSHPGAARLPVIAVITVGHGHGFLRALLAPLFAALIAACGRLPASLGRAKHDRLIVGGMLGGNAAWLLKCVPKKVTMPSPSIGSARSAQAAHPCYPSEHGARRASLAAIAGPRMRNQSKAMVPTPPLKASR
jgi:hypothetical protein